MRDSFLPFAPPLIGEEEAKELLDTLKSGWLTTGPKTELFQERICQYIGSDYAVAVNSGTAALHLSLAASEIGQGDEVILPTYTFASTAHAVQYQRAKPVLVDIDPITYNITPEVIEAAITPRTKAIIPVHFAGLPCELEAIYNIADKNNLIVIEDAAHAIGSEYKGKKVGAFGRLTCFSFYATKNITTGEGGMVVTDNEELAEKMRVLSMYGISDARRIWKRYAPRGSWFYDITDLGFKYNMMDIQAAIGIHQLSKLDQFIEKRKHFADLYFQGFSKTDQITLPFPADNNEIKHAFHAFPILINSKMLSIDRDRFIEELKDRNIGTSVLFRPLHLHSYYKQVLGHEKGAFPVSENIYERTISLPISPCMDDQDLSSVIMAVNEICNKYQI
jgi:dTDP-4-amino-4,6-dideoxygalactose transaminase